MPEASANASADPAGLLSAVIRKNDRLCNEREDVLGGISAQQEAVPLSSLQLVHISMFDGRAFHTWGRIVLGACGFAILFLGVMVLGEEVVGEGARVSRAAVTISAAAFVGYVGTAWIIRRDEPIR